MIRKKEKFSIQYNKNEKISTQKLAVNLGKNPRIGYMIRKYKIPTQYI